MTEVLTNCAEPSPGAKSRLPEARSLFEISKCPAMGSPALPDSITDAIDASPVTPMRSNPPIFLNSSEVDVLYATIGLPPVV